MSPICQYILSQFAAGIPLCKVCREYLGEYCDEQGIERIGYYEVKRWLTMSMHKEEFREFRKEYRIIQKNLMPILIDELRYEAEEIMYHVVDDKKKEIDVVDPKRLDGFRARLAALKFLASYLRASHRSNPATQARKIAAKSLPSTHPDQNPSNSVSEIVHRTSSIVNNPIDVLSSLPGLGISLPKLTLQSAEEILGSPIISNEINDEDCRGVLHTPYLIETLTPAFTPSIENDDVFQHLSYDHRENFKKSICEVDEIVNHNSKIVNPTALCQNSHQTPIIYRQIPNFHSRNKPNPG
jgi:hypothetical protein